MLLFNLAQILASLQNRHLAKLTVQGRLYGMVKYKIITNGCNVMPATYFVCCFMEGMYNKHCTVK